MESLGSPEAMPNLDIESKGPTHTTTVVCYVPYINYKVMLIYKLIYYLK